MPVTIPQVRAIAKDCRDNRLIGTEYGLTAYEVNAIKVSHARRFPIDVVSAIACDPRPTREVAKLYATTTKTVNDIKSSRSWSFVEMDRVQRSNGRCGPGLGEKHFRSILTADQVLAIVGSTATPSELSAIHGCSASNIEAVRRGRSRSHLTGIKYKLRRKRGEK